MADIETRLNPAPEHEKQRILKIIKQYANTYSVPYDIIAGVAEQESKFDRKARRYNPDNVADRSYGVMQLTIPTAQWISDKYLSGKYDITEDLLYGAEVNIHLGTLYLKYLLEKYPNKSDAISAYNAGRPIKMNMAYVQNVLAFAAKYKAPTLIIIAGIVLAFILLRGRE